MCKFSDSWVQIGWPIYRDGELSPKDYKVNSVYDVYCKKCKKYCNLLSCEEIKDLQGRIRLDLY